MVTNEEMRETTGTSCCIEVCVCQSIAHARKLLVKTLTRNCLVLRPSPHTQLVRLSYFYCFTLDNSVLVAEAVWSDFPSRQGPVVIEQNLHDILISV